ncbi:hypothetical protein M3B22_06350 [Staphylococcus epidermidis]|jgi:hypothetical protein|uniref:hypothetical protein n=1 Tax=Staphylococcus TaxID=1279 RepID=UPI00066A5194|nr:hypothetical protein [Staphylococcus epidermidis]MBM0775240.1 hypothetical protein [Staphylococcus epidermidis]MBM0863891.1 hypothetical protein [Staphylococcus epidermidis]MBM5966915.1 hypothetical protein [Staphylococcus epidermidis]MBM5969205.1 hypothetical protein [Staphylococcus epidermidis]MBM6076632.1 hypothetical protein [Staphylococcus epidermidis]
MNINIFEAYADTMESNCELYRFMGEFDRITEFTGYLIEKAKAYREEGDIKGAEAIEQIVLDDLGSEFYIVQCKFREERKTWKQKVKKLKDVCTFYGIPVSSLKSEKVINFYK